MANFRQVVVSRENPKENNWYNTDKGLLYWFNGFECWSCRNDRVSEEYPFYWYEPID